MRNTVRRGLLYYSTYTEKNITKIPTSLFFLKVETVAFPSH